MLVRFKLKKKFDQNGSLEVCCESGGFGKLNWNDKASLVTLS